MLAIPATSYYHTHTMHHVRIYTQINTTENLGAVVPLLIVPALCNLSCFGVEMSIQFSRRDHYQRCLLPRSCIVKTSKQVHTDRCIQIIGHQCVLLDIFTVLNQQTRTIKRLSPILVLQHGLGTGPSLAACPGKAFSS